jgi:cobalt-zinc-cadmium efflux system outer membrane protein
MRTRLFTPAALLGCILILPFGAVNAADQPTLTALVRTVLDDNPRVLAARSALDAATARETAADQPLYNPDLDIDYEDTGDVTKTLGLSQTIDWADKREARTRVAALERERVVAELAGVRQALATELLDALADYHTASELTALAEQRRTLMQRFLALSEQRRQAGDLGQVELDLARLAATEANLQRVRLVGLQAQAEQALMAVADAGSEGWPVLPEIPSASRLDTKNIDDLLEQLPALRVIRTQFATARADVELSRRERRADPTIGVRGGRDASDNLIGLTLSIPLFVRNNFSAEVEAASADAIQIEQSAQDSYRHSRARLVSAAQRFELSRQAWDDWLQTGQTSLESQTQLLERLWQAGELSTSDYLVQLKQTLDTRTAAAELRGSLWQAWFEWLAASGKTESWLGLND